MVTNNRKRRTDNLGQKKKTLLKKAHKLRKYDGVNMAVIIRQNSKFFTYRSVNHKSWPPSIEEIIRLCHLDTYTC
jgi:hypothetical protein